MVKKSTTRRWQRPTRLSACEPRPETRSVGRHGRWGNGRAHSRVQGLEL
jgi:hypothetical protein